MEAAVVPRTFISVSGPDAEAYLQGQLSQDVAPGGGLAFLLEPTGKVVAFLRFVRAGSVVVVHDGVLEHQLEHRRDVALAGVDLQLERVLAGERARPRHEHGEQRLPGSARDDQLAQRELPGRRQTAPQQRLTHRRRPRPADSNDRDPTVGGPRRDADQRRALELAHARNTTTWRRRPSPSDSVRRPPISFIVMCTTRRSIALIGSKIQNTRANVRAMSEFLCAQTATEAPAASPAMN